MKIWRKSFNNMKDNLNKANKNLKILLKRLEKDSNNIKSNRPIKLLFRKNLEDWTRINKSKNRTKSYNRHQTKELNLNSCKSTLTISKWSSNKSSSTKHKTKHFRKKYNFRKKLYVTLKRTRTNVSKSSNKMILKLRILT